MRVLIVGAGAVGGYFGARLAETGAEVVFLVRGARREQLLADGIRLAALDGSIASIPVSTTTADRLDSDYELVILAVKSTALTDALGDIAPAVGPDTAVLPLLNGIRHLAVLQNRFGAERILGGVGLVATELQPDGLIRQVAPGAGIAFGERDGTVTSRVEAIAALLDPAGFDSRVSTTIEQEMWEKWFFMATGGATTVLLGGPAGEVTAVDDGEDLVRRILAEASSVLAAEGHAVRPEAAAMVSGVLTRAGSRFTTSMYRDFRAGRRTEVELILGDLLRLAQTHGLPTPLLAAATVRLRVHERALDAAAS